MVKSSDSTTVTKKQKPDTVSVRIPPEMRQRLEAMSTLGKGVTVVFRNVAFLGLALVDYCQKNLLAIPSPKDFEKWLMGASARFAPESDEFAELKEACQKLGVKPPESGKIAIWLLDFMTPFVGNTESGSSDETSSPLLSAGAGAIEEIASDGFADLTVRELLTACQELGISAPKKGNVKAWLSALPKPIRNTTTGVEATQTVRQEHPSNPETMQTPPIEMHTMHLLALELLTNPEFGLSGLAQTPDEVHLVQRATNLVQQCILGSASNRSDWIRLKHDSLPFVGSLVCDAVSRIASSEKNPDIALSALRDAAEKIIECNAIRAREKTTVLIREAFRG